jgi:hypothetical protein
MKRIKNGELENIVILEQMATSGGSEGLKSPNIFHQSTSTTVSRKEPRESRNIDSLNMI